MHNLHVRRVNYEIPLREKMALNQEDLNYIAFRLQLQFEYINDKVFGEIKPPTPPPPKKPSIEEIERQKRKEAEE